MCGLISKVCKWLSRWGMPFNSECEPQLPECFKNATAETGCSPEAGARMPLKFNGISTVFIFAKSIVWKDSKSPAGKVFSIPFSKSINNEGNQLQGPPGAKWRNCTFIRRGCSTVCLSPPWVTVICPCSRASRGRMTSGRTVHFLLAGARSSAVEKDSSGPGLRFFLNKWGPLVLCGARRSGGEDHSFLNPSKPVLRLHCCRKKLNGWRWRGGPQEWRCGVGRRRKKGEKRKEGGKGWAGEGRK